MSNPQKDPLFTVITATYNREHMLQDAFMSLQEQTFTDFEWVVVDDGSTDATRALVEGWVTEAPFPLRYVHQENAGKPAAHNRGVQEARGEFVVSLDSDDVMAPTALERLLAVWRSVPPEERGSFVGVAGLTQDQHGSLRGTPFPRDIMDSDAAELRFRYGVTGDKFGFNRTDVLREHPFVIPEGSKFVSEDLLWFEIAQKYRIRFFNEVLLTVSIDDGGEHLSQLTPAVLTGRRGLHRFIINDIPGMPRMNPFHFLRSSVAYARYGFDLDEPLRTQLPGLAPMARAGVVLGSPAARILAARDRRQGVTAV